MAYEGIIKTDGYGRQRIGNVDVSNIEWITGSYTFIPDLTSVGGNTFNLLYQSGQLLFDQYTPAIAGGALAANVPTTETYACPFKASGAITWTEVNPGGSGIGANYEVDGLNPTHLGRVRSKKMVPFSYAGADGYSYEMFLLFGHTQDAGVGIAAHYFFWVYMENTTGLWTRVPNTDSGLPSVGENFDIWIPTSVNVPNAKWSAWLIQDSDKRQGSSGSGTGGSEQIKIEDTIASANEADGTTAFSSGDISSLPNLAVSGVIMAFINGLEINTEIGNPATVGPDVDIVFSNVSGTYPTLTPIFWHGSSFGVSASTLGDAHVGDVIRIYYLI